MIAPKPGRPIVMQNQAQRPWLRLYRGVQPELKPACETALDMFRATLARDAGAPLVYYFDRSLSAAECDAMSDALAVGLQQRGVEVGDRVAVYLQNVPQVVIAVLAIWKCGAVVVPCNPMLRERELGKILRSSGCLAMICQDDLYADVGRAALPSTAVRHTITTSPLEFLDSAKPLPVVLAGVRRETHGDASDMLEVIAGHNGERPRPVELTGDDVAFMIYTSGTTGDPKGAMNTHRNVVFATSVYERWIGLTSRDVILGLAPLFHVTGLIGKSGDPSPVTAYGVYRGIKACARHRYGSDALTGKVVVIQGAGHVGYHLAQLLHREDAKLVVTDIDPAKVKRVVGEFGAVGVAPDDIYAVAGNVFAPCALGGIINDQTVPVLKVEIVAGGANNQLADERHGDLLEQRGIVYAPDYVINGGGLINVNAELNGWTADRARHKAGEIYDTILRVFEIAKEEGIPSYRAADRLAEQRIAAVAMVRSNFV